MNRRFGASAITILAGALIFGGHAEVSAQQQGSTQRVLQSYGKLPLTFEANFGQADPAVKFLARGRGYGLFLTSTEAVLVVNAGNELRWWNQYLKSGTGF